MHLHLVSILQQELVHSNDLIISGGNGTFINATYIGVNTDQRPITEGIALESPSELWVSEKNGIGIGSTSGDRATNVNFYVGLKRDGADLIDTQAIFETGVGIGTTLCSRGNKVEIYKDTFSLETILDLVAPHSV